MSISSLRLKPPLRSHSIGSSQNLAVRASRWTCTRLGFGPVIREKEKAIPALTENRRHLTSLLDELCDAKPASSIEHRESRIWHRLKQLLGYQLLVTT